MADETGSEDTNNEVIVQETSDSSYTASLTDVTYAILSIPATLIVIAFFACIYRIFINRRTRG